MKTSTDRGRCRTLGAAAFFATLILLLAGGWGTQAFADCNDADAAIQENMASAEGAVQTVGTTAGLTAWVRIYDQISDLIGALQMNGFDVWIVSASPQYVVERHAAKINIAAGCTPGFNAPCRIPARLCSTDRAERSAWPSVPVLIHRFKLWFC